MIGNFTNRNCQSNLILFTFFRIFNHFFPITTNIPPSDPKLLKTIDILGREVKKGQNKILIDILDDGSSNKRFVLEKIDWI